MQMTRDGKETAEIRAFIDKKYSGYGPPTDTGPVPESQLGVAGPPLPGKPDSLPAGMDAAGSCGEAATSCQESGK